MKIRPFRQDDARVVSDIHNILFPDEKRSTANVRHWLEDGHAWVIEDEEVMGYTAVFSLPGLDGVGSLAGGIALKYQRQGLGTKLLLRLIREAKPLGYRQLSYGLADLNSPAAHFLRHHNFVIEHQEWFLRLSPLSPFSPDQVLTDHLQIQPRVTDSQRLFCQLYDKSFGGTPWYQRYKQTEVAETLTDPEDILFLAKNKTPIGFAWLQGESIEPMGIVKEEQGQGYGRYLLQFALNELKSRGANHAKVGVWRDNYAAIHLYQSVGFQHRQTLTYMALKINRD